MNESEIQSGRPYGGATILYRRFMQITEPVWLQSKRVCVIKIVLEHSGYYLFNVYIPCDVSTCIDSYVEVLSDISNYVLCDDIVHFVLGGDFNTNVRRHNSCHTMTLKLFIADECLSTDVSTVEYTFTGALGTSSLIDHFIVTVGMAEDVSCYKQLESVYNLSDNLPIVVHLDYDLEYAVPMSPFFIPKPKWDYATQTDIDNYHEQLDVRLLQETPPECLMSCDDLQCKNQSHEIYQRHDIITHACSEAARVTITVSRMGCKRVSTGFQCG